MRLTRLDLGIALLLLAGTVAAFSPAFGAAFVAIDDPVYVERNRHVATGLTAENAGWAWTTFYQSNWHPLTWLSLQLDASLAKTPDNKLDPHVFHRTSILLHAANAALLFFALRALTGCRWRSAVVAGLFALHPLRVESVAWVSERKDVLSLFFGLLALWAYAGYVRNRSAGRYLAVAALLALSLLSKPTLVTLPCLLLVLDWWPLLRTRLAAEGLPATAASTGITAQPSSQLETATGWGWLAAEKVPLLALSLASCVVTFVAQQTGGSVHNLTTFTLADRVAGAVVAYSAYLSLTAWPVHLAPFYPFPAGGWPAGRVAAAALAIGGLTALAVWQRRRRPYLLAGWLWYVGTLVPVIGLVQVGNQAYADRYTYFPSIGLALALVWTVAEAVPAALARPSLAVAAGLLLVLGGVTWRQSGVWVNDLTLWPHTVEVTGDNAFAYSNVGVACEARDNNFKEAIHYYQQAVRINPAYGTAQYNLARALRAQGQMAEAVKHFRAALLADPRLSDAHNDLGLALNDQGAAAQAEAEFREALRLEPDSATAHRNLGSLLENQGHGEEAVEHYAAAVRVAPDDGAARERLGFYLYRHGSRNEAIEHIRRAAELQPYSASAHSNLGVVLEKAGQESEALACFRRAVELNPKDMRSRLRLATALARSGDTPGADEQYKQALRLNRSWPEELSREAWRRSTSADPGERDGSIAVWSAESACNAIRPPPAPYLDALAAAYAEAGRFPEATAAAEKAVAAAQAAHKADLAQAIAGRLALYREGRPFHEPPKSGAQ
jgi:tetratricopeptide (TPR) repeat protein